MGMFGRSVGAFPLVLASVIAVCVGSTGSARAASIDCWSATTLADAIAADAITCAGRTLSDFAFETSSTSGAATRAPEDIAFEMGVAPWAHIVHLTALWDAPPGESITGTLSFRFADMRVDAATVGLYSEQDWSNGTVEARICSEGELPCEAGMLVGPEFPFQTFPRVHTGSVTLRFVLASDYFRPDPAPTTVYALLVVPEPGACGLVFLGLAGVARARRRTAAARAR